MTLAEDTRSPVVAADWIGKLFMLGRLAAHWSREHVDNQLVIALSVPVRDFAAVLVGCGWMTATAPPSLPSVRRVLADLSPHEPVRMVTQDKVLTREFGGLNETKDRAQFGTEWQIDKLQAVIPLESREVQRGQPSPAPGVISKLTGMDKDWVARLCLPPQDLALVGTLKLLSKDLTAFLGRGNERESVTNILLPADLQAATWSTRLYTASQLEAELLPSGVRAVVLDGASATRYLSAIDAPVVISILDRSVADESVPELVLNYRNTRGEPVSLEHDLSWKTPAGVEALAFEVAL